MRSANAVLRSETTSGSSDDGFHLSPAAARRFARRNLRRTSTTPDLVTSLVRPPSPNAFYVTPQLHSQARQEVLARAAQQSALQGQSRAASERRSGPALAPHLSSLDIPERYGGRCVFDMYSLTYAVDPDPNLLCPICHDPLVDPVTTPCDHTFCYRCLRGSIVSSPSGTACPIDREPLSWLDCTSAARVVRMQLNSLMVKCPHHGRGCKVEMRRESAEAHANTDCGFREYPCPEPDCDKRLRFKPKEKTCLHHEENCSYCEAEIQAADHYFHLLSCSKSKTRCTGCWDLIPKDQLSSHHEADCDGVETGCPYQDLGCSVRSERGIMSSHALGCAFHPETPSGIIIRSQRELIESYGDIGSQLQELKACQAEASRRIEELTTGMTRSAGSNAVISDNRTMQDFDAGFEEIHQNLTRLEARQSMWTLNQVMPIRDEVTELRNNINMIRMHVNWLLNRSREEGRIRAANNAGTSTTIRRDSSGEAVPVMPERRRSSGTETDLPRL